eukprot:1376418-Pyramimonas_sp.AAC.1
MLLNVLQDLWTCMGTAHDAKEISIGAVTWVDARLLYHLHLLLSEDGLHDIRALICFRLFLGTSLPFRRVGSPGGPE